MWTFRNKTNGQTRNRLTESRTVGCQGKWSGVGKEDLSGKTSSYEVGSRGGITYSMRNEVDNVTVILYGGRWLLDLHGDHFTVYLIVSSLCCTPEANIMYVN